MRVNCRERLAAAKARVEAALGDAITPSLDLFEGDLGRELRSRGARVPNGPAPGELPELPPELARQVHAAILQRLAGMLDEPISAVE